MEAFESGLLDIPNFYFTGDDYRYRFETEARERFLDLLRERYNTGARYMRRNVKWDTVIEHKAVELGRYLGGRSSKLDFSEPSPELDSVGSRELRKAILRMSPTEAKRRRIGKSTFHYLRKNAESGRSFRTYGKVLSKLQSQELRSDLVAEKV
jgi:hypothetical protein